MRVLSTHLWVSALGAVVTPLAAAQQPVERPPQTHSSHPNWQLRWERDGQGNCLDEASARRRLAPLVQDHPWTASEHAEHTVTVSLGRDRAAGNAATGNEASADSPPWRGTLQLHRGDVVLGTRQFESHDDCAALSDLLLLSVSLSVGALARGVVSLNEAAAPGDTHPATVGAVENNNAGNSAARETTTRPLASPAPSTTAPSEVTTTADRMRDETRPSPTVSLAAEGGVLGGAFASLSAVFELSALWRWLWLSTWLTPPVTAGDVGAPANVNVWALGASFGACPWRPQFAWGEVALCGTLDAAAVSGDAAAVPTGPRWALYLASRLRLSASVPLGGSLAFVASAGLGPVWLRPRFEATGAVPLLTTAAWVGSVSAGFSLNL